MAQEAENTTSTPQPEGGETTTTESKPEATQEDTPQTFDKAYVSELRGEAAKWRIEAQQAREKVEEFEEAQKSEIEKAQSRVEKEQKRAAEAEAKLTRFEVAQEKSVPAELIPLLSGSDRETLEAQADLIVKHANGKQDEEPPEFDGGARESAGETDPEAGFNDTVLTALGLLNR